MIKMRIKNLVNVKDVRTVVQIADILDPKLRDFLTESFVITDEVEKILLSFFKDLTANHGKGYFIEGNFGSGKSHLLSVISLLTSYNKSWEHILKQKSNTSSLKKLSEKIIGKKYITINLSLVEHSNKEYLEDIVIEELINFINEDNRLTDFDFKGESEFIEKISTIIINEHANRLKSFLRENKITKSELFQPGQLYLIEKLLNRLNLPYRFNYNRQQIFAQISTIIDNNKYDGLIILIDELSEFLRSKPDGRRFNEDIRFMQFLGEYAKRKPCWVLASLQEEIEKTGETTPEAFNKIKDRYPTRFYLTGQHIKELIDKRLIELKEDKKSFVEKIYQDYQESFPHLPFQKKEFIKLYPVHPQAIDLLDNLKPLFSQHRGIIDFIHYQLKGDPGRSIEGMMDLSAENLLTADKIFDHFVDRIREMMETSPFYTKVYKYYEQEIGSLLEEGEKNTGLKIIKLLILFAISPIDKKYNVEEIANMLFYKITDLDPAINYEYIDDILNRLYQRGAYLIKKEAKQKRSNVYFIDLKADVNLIIKRRTEYIKSNLFKNDNRIFTKLGRQVREKFLPLNNLFSNNKQQRTVSWQNTDRKGFLYFLPIRDISIDNINQTAQHLTHGEKDFMLIMSYAMNIEDDKEYLNKVLLPQLNEAEKASFVFWIPQKIKDKEFLKDALARIILLEKYEKDSSKTGEKIKTQLTKQIKEEKDRISKIFRDVYFRGEIINGFKEKVINLADLGFLPFHRLIDKIVSGLLEDKFPDHKKISPYQSILSTAQLEAVLEDFISVGEIENLKNIDGQVLNVIDAFMKPMGLIKKRKSGIRLNIKPHKNPLIKKLFELVEEDKTAIDDIYLKLRKGSYGMSNNQFKLLVYSLLYSGYLSAYSDHKKISLKNLNARNFKRIKYIGYGELIDEDFQMVLSSCSLLPPRYQKRHFTLPLQHSIWQHLIDKKKELNQRLNNMRYQVERLESDDDFTEFDFTNMINYINKVENLLSEIMVSYSSEEGLERFAAKYRNMPNIDSYLEKFEQLEYFLSNNLNKYKKMLNYLKHPELDLPSKQKYSDLLELKKNLVKAMNDRAVIYDKKFFDELNNKFTEFKQRYIEIYIDEHAKQKGSDHFKSITEMRTTRSYQVLKSLAGIELISVKDDLVKIDRLIAKALSKSCSINPQSRLQDIPICECKFKLGHKIELPSKNNLQKIIDSGVQQYINSLKEKEHKQRLENYLDNMEAAGNKRFARPIRNLLAVKINKNLYKNLDKILNQNVIKRINSVLSGDISLIERNLDELYENLINRSFSPTQIRQIFNEWLKGSTGLGQKTYIKVKGNFGQGSQQMTTAQDNLILIDYIKQNYPELLNLIENTDFNIFIKLLAVVVWKNIYKIDSGLESLINKIIPENSTLIIEELQRNHNLEDSFTEMFESLYTSNQNQAIKKLITSKIDQIDLSSRLIDLISPANLDEVIEIIEIEKLSTKVINKVLIQFVKMIENIHLNYQTKETLITQTEDINKKIDESQLSKYKKDALNLILNYLSLEKSFAYLDSQDNFNDIKEWKEVYVNHLANLEFNYYKIIQLSSQLDITDIIPQSIKYKKTIQTLHNYQNLFNNFHDSRDIMGEDYEKFMGNNLIYLLKDRYPYLLKKMNTKKGYLILLDGMRWDIWKLIKNEINKNLPLRLIEEGSIFALSPTNTETQFEALKKAGQNIKLIDQKEVSGSLQSLSQNKKTSKEIIKFSFIDDKVHSCKDNYIEFLKEIVFLNQNRLLPFLEKITSGSAILLFSDHGFKINHGFKEINKYEEPRYLHGGGSFHEIIVPWAFMYKP